MEMVKEALHGACFKYSKRKYKYYLYSKNKYLSSEYKDGSFNIFMVFTYRKSDFFTNIWYLHSEKLTFSNIYNYHNLRRS